MAGAATKRRPDEIKGVERDSKDDDRRQEQSGRKAESQKGGYHPQAECSTGGGTESCRPRTGINTGAGGMDAEALLASGGEPGESRMSCHCLLQRPEDSD